MTKKIFFIVLDGLSDGFKTRTPLALAKTPYMDDMARKGVAGIIDVLGGIAPESDAAVLSLLGYDARKHYCGRGPLEAYGYGMDFRKGMLGLRCNFATSSDGEKLVDRRAKRSLDSDEAAKLAGALQKQVKLSGAKFFFRASLAHRAVLVIDVGKGYNLSKKISNTDPAYGIVDGIPEALSKFEMKLKNCEPLVAGAKAKRSAELVNEFTKKAFDILDNHQVNKIRRKKGLVPANMILSRDAGNALPRLPKLKGKWAILADMPLEVGIGRLAGMDVVKCPLLTMTAKDYDVRYQKVVETASEYDALYVHLKGPDLYGHDGDSKGKRKSIEDIDSHFFKPMLERYSGSDILWVVTADHSTPCTSKGHSADPVPVMVYGSGSDPDVCKKFSEMQCRRGNIGSICGHDLMPLMIKWAGL